MKGQKLEYVPGIRTQGLTIVPQCLFEKLIDNGLEVLVVLNAKFSLDDADYFVVVLHSDDDIQDGFKLLFVRLQFEFLDGVENSFGVGGVGQLLAGQE
jgi:hypothetical protein